jgi:multisubunit Na+/H+ antiporter MnhC subunit
MSSPTNSSISSDDAFARAALRRAGGLISAPIATLLWIVVVVTVVGHLCSPIKWWPWRIKPQDTNSKRWIMVVQLVSLVLAATACTCDSLMRLGTFLDDDLARCKNLGQVFVLCYVGTKWTLFRFMTLKMSLTQDEENIFVKRIVNILSVILLVLIVVVAYLTTGELEPPGTGVCNVFFDRKDKTAAIALLITYIVVELAMNATFLYLFLKPLMQYAISDNLVAVVKQNLVLGTFTLGITSICMIILAVFIIMGTKVAAIGSSVTNIEILAACFYQAFSLRKTWKCRCSKKRPSKLQSDNMINVTKNSAMDGQSQHFVQFE